jgi:uncharacterized protein (DUF4415 family)
MSKKPNPELIDEDNPEWTEADIRSARHFDQMPAQFQAATRRARGPQKTPTKQQVTLRLSPDLLEHFRNSGPGWQSRIDDALRDWVKHHA